MEQNPQIETKLDMLDGEQYIDKETGEIKDIDPMPQGANVPEHYPVLTNSKTPASQFTGVLALLEKAMSLPNFNADQLVKLFDMHKEMEDRERERAFNEDMAIAQNRMEAVVVNRKNPHSSSLFADISAIHKMCKPIWTAQGFSVVSYSVPSDIDGMVKIVCTVRHRAGHKVEFFDYWPMDNVGTGGKVNKTDIQGKGSTISYARRYMELMFFDIAVARTDRDGAPAVIEAEMSDETAEKLRKLGIDPTAGKSK